MNRYPLWKYAIMLIALRGRHRSTRCPTCSARRRRCRSRAARPRSRSTPRSRRASRTSSPRPALKPDFVQYDGNSVKARFADLDAQRKAKDAISAALNPDPNDPNYIVALNLLSRSPHWLTALHALPMYLGLDLRGGVHFLMQVDMKAALDQEGRPLPPATCARCCATRTSATPASRRDGNERRRALPRRRRRAPQARNAARRPAHRPRLAESQDGSRLQARRQPQARRRTSASRTAPITQNITILHNRVNELGVAEPVIQQQGADRVVVQLPGVQDTARAKDIIGRTATLEMRMVDDSTEARWPMSGAGPVPFGNERYTERGGAPLLVKRQVRAHRRAPHRRAARLRRPEPTSRRCTSRSTARGARIMQGRHAREHRQAHGDPAVREGQGRGRHRAGDPRRARQPLPDLAAA